MLIRLGFRVAVPPGYEMQIRSKSGLALDGIHVLNSPGTVDSDYRGEVGVILHNTTDEFYSIKEGDRIAQAVIAAVPVVEYIEVSSLDVTVRGDGGFGSTGKS